MIPVFIKPIIGAVNNEKGINVISACSSSSVSICIGCISSSSSSVGNTFESLLLSITISSSSSVGTSVFTSLINIISSDSVSIDIVTIDCAVSVKISVYVESSFVAIYTQYIYIYIYHTNPMKTSLETYIHCILYVQ